MLTALPRIILKTFVPKHRPAKPDYGSDVFVRSIIIATTRPGHVALALEDTGHAFRIDFAHDDKYITAIKAEWIRHPLTSCPGAVNQLQKLIGCPLSDDLFAIADFTLPRSHCTHMFDAMAVAIVHAKQQREDCRYDIIVPDAGSIDRPVQASLDRNGTTVLTLELQDYSYIIAPAPYAGRGVFKGFLKWARNKFDSETVEHCYLMQKALIPAGGQSIDLESGFGEAAPLHGPPEGSCFGSDASRYKSAVTTDSLRRFKKESNIELLKFFDI